MSMSKIARKELLKDLIASKRAYKDRYMESRDLRKMLRHTCHKDYPSRTIANLLDTLTEQERDILGGVQIRYFGSYGREYLIGQKDIEGDGKSGDSAKFVDIEYGIDTPKRFRYERIKAIWTSLIRALDIWLQEGHTNEWVRVGKLWQEMQRISKEHNFELMYQYGSQGLTSRLESIRGLKIGMQMGLQIETKWDKKKGQWTNHFLFERPFDLELDETYLMALYENKLGQLRWKDE